MTFSLVAVERTGSIMPKVRLRGREYRTKLTIRAISQEKSGSEPRVARGDGRAVVANAWGGRSTGRGVSPCARMAP